MLKDCTGKPIRLFQKVVFSKPKLAHVIIGEVVGFAGSMIKIKYHHDGSSYTFDYKKTSNYLYAIED